MAGRIRTIKPEILTDSKAARLSHEAWRLWVSSWVMADDAGRLPGSPELLRASVFWGREGDLERALDELQAAGLVTRYRVHGEPYLAINGWAKHQRINRPSGARCPSPVEGEVEPGRPDPGRQTELPIQATGIAPFNEGSLTPHGGLSEGSLPDHDHDHYLDHDHDRESKVLPKTRRRPSPSARHAVPVEAEQLADLLRQQLVAEKTDHILSRAERWRTTRTTWAEAMALMLRVDGRSPARAAALIRWVFGDQSGAEKRFVVESPKALREKWDRIETAMNRPRRVNGTPPATGGDEDPILEPRRRHV
jgi:hypothetical protein